MNSGCCAWRLVLLLACVDCRAPPVDYWRDSNAASRGERRSIARWYAREFGQPCGNESLIVTPADSGLNDWLRAESDRSSNFDLGYSLSRDL